MSPYVGSQSFQISNVRVKMPKAKKRNSDKTWKKNDNKGKNNGSPYYVRNMFKDGKNSNLENDEKIKRPRRGTIVYKHDRSKGHDSESSQNSHSDADYSSATVDTEKVSVVDKSKLPKMSIDEFKSLDDLMNMRRIRRLKNIRKIWKYYEKLTDEKVRCIRCGIVQKYRNGIGNLRQHLIKIHGERFTKIPIDCEKFCDTASESSSESEYDIPVLKRLKKNSRSKEKLTETDERTNSVVERGNTDEEITNSIVSMLVVDRMPLSTVENKGFQSMMNTVVPLYTVPSKKIIARLLDERYDGSINGSVLNLATIDYCTLTFDNLTIQSNDQKRLDIFVNYITKESRYENIRVLSLALPFGHTNKYLMDIINSSIRNTGLERSKITAVVMGRGSKTRKAVKLLFPKDKYLDCITYSLSLILSSLSRMIPATRTMIKKINIIASMTERSVEASDELKKLQIRDGKTEESALKFIQEDGIYWNSTIIMLERFLTLERYVSSVLSRLPEKPDIPTGKEKMMLNDFLQLMKIIQDAVAELRVYPCLTCGIVIPTINGLKISIERYEPRTNYGFELRNKLLSKIAASFRNHESHDILAISTILDPRFKTTYFEFTLDASCAISQICQIIRSSELRDKTKISNELINNEQRDACDIWNFEEKFIEMKAAVKTEDEKIRFGLQQYLNEPVLLRNEDPLVYWKSRKHDFPLLYELALKYLCIVANSVPLEELFHRKDYKYTTKP